MKLQDLVIIAERAIRQVGKWINKAKIIVIGLVYKKNITDYGEPNSVKIKRNLSISEAK